jgi:hypothetical protein
MTNSNMATKMRLMTTTMNPKCGTGPILIGFITPPKLSKDYPILPIGRMQRAIGKRGGRFLGAITR